MVATFAALRRLSPRREVVVPAYTCYTVPSAVAAAGLRCVPCDISAEHFGFDLDVLDQCLSRDTLCVVPTHLYGIPCDVTEVVRRAREHGAWVLEDAAQGLGGSWHQAALGTTGDVGLFSLGRGKNVTTGHGGMLFVPDSGLAQEIENQVTFLGINSVWRETLACLGGAALGMLARPPFYGCLARIPALEIGVSRFDPEIPVVPLGGFELRLLRRVLSLVAEYRGIRIRIANRYRQELADIPYLRSVQVPEGGQPAWLRFPILLPEEMRARLFRSPARHYGLSSSYPASVPEIPGIGRFLAERCGCPRARRIAREVVTLPTHPGVRDQHILSIVDCLRKLN